MLSEQEFLFHVKNACASRVLKLPFWISYDASASFCILFGEKIKKKCYKVFLLHSDILFFPSFRSELMLQSIIKLCEVTRSLYFPKCLDLCKCRNWCRWWLALNFSVGWLCGGFFVCWITSRRFSGSFFFCQHQLWMRLRLTLVLVSDDEHNKYLSFFSLLSITTEGWGWNSHNTSWCSMQVP